MARAGNVYLIGPMGSGKTAVGRALARRLRRPFLDTDAMIERRARLRVPEIFARRGERAFRALERAAARDAARVGGRVVALGGGAPSQPAIRALLARTGIVVRLTCDQRELWRRLVGKADGRPLLRAPTAAESRGRLAALLRKRAGDYPKGDLRVSTSLLTVEGAARVIQRKLTSHAPHHASTPGGGKRAQDAAATPVGRGRLYAL